jgi:peptidoglycan/LPS O-acetylase OafA/YrhL
MRAIAVLAVFANHLFHWPSGGFVGVDVFFVLSGYFITGLLIRERTTTGGVSFLNFYTRRAKRILPTAMLVLVVTVGAAYLLLPAARAMFPWNLVI